MFAKRRHKSWSVPSTRQSANGYRNLQRIPLRRNKKRVTHKRFLPSPESACVKLKLKQTFQRFEEIKAARGFVRPATTANCAAPRRCKSLNPDQLQAFVKSHKRKSADAQASPTSSPTGNVDQHSDAIMFELQEPGSGMRLLNKVIVESGRQQKNQRASSGATCSLTADVLTPPHSLQEAVTSTSTVAPTTATTDPIDMNGIASDSEHPSDLDTDDEDLEDEDEQHDRFNTCPLDYFKSPALASKNCPSPRLSPKKGFPLLGQTPTCLIIESPTSKRARITRSARQEALLQARIELAVRTLDHALASKLGRRILRREARRKFGHSKSRARQAMITYVKLAVTKDFTPLEAGIEYERRHQRQKYATQPHPHGHGDV